jgi:lipid-binding SYLF domain-containing protein
MEFGTPIACAKGMKKTFLTLCTTLMTLAGMAMMAPAKEHETESARRLAAAQDVLKTAMNGDDQSIPRELIEKSHCVAILPGMKQGGFIIGAKFGRGYLFCRKNAGAAAVRIEGGSIGLQIGAGEADVVMLVMNEAGADKILRNEFKIGANAGVMAGPLGRTTQAETDAYMRAEILGYSRSRGIFAGLSLDGSTFREDREENSALYGKKLTNQTILADNGPATPASAQPLTTMLTGISTWEKK